jgi:hypothetical protein
VGRILEQEALDGLQIATATGQMHIGRGYAWEAWELTPVDCFVRKILLAREASSWLQGAAAVTLRAAAAAGVAVARFQLANQDKKKVEKQQEIRGSFSGSKPKLCFVVCLLFFVTQGPKFFSFLYQNEKRVQKVTCS